MAYTCNPNITSCIANSEPCLKKQNKNRQNDIIFQNNLIHEDKYISIFISQVSQDYIPDLNKNKNCSHPKYIKMLAPLCF